ncbi:MAG TPA: L,D-transpeptidase [Candidatus Saccharimonadales bacterium]|nr:L,D-transpeptidase [Candidatus Saccharimonadales bacterium]
MKTSLENKTIRPGLLIYSAGGPRRAELPAAGPKHRHGHAVVSLLVALVVGFGLFAGYRTYHAHHQAKTPAPAPAAAKQAAAVSAGPQECNGNSLDKQIIVSISARHLWACDYHKVVYNTPVVTGMEFLAADLTPPGTYKIYAKQTNVTLTGQDSTGKWSDPVYYWMPFLTNQYGAYGFHDATWRPNNAFGNIDPNSKDASHGCVELPLSASKWLYNWAQVGTQVTIKS